jgi:hypothetical protein
LLWQSCINRTRVIGYYFSATSQPNNNKKHRTITPCVHVDPSLPIETTSTEKDLDGGQTKASALYTLYSLPNTPYTGRRRAWWTRKWAHETVNQSPIRLSRNRRDLNFFLLVLLNCSNIYIVTELWLRGCWVLESVPMVLYEICFLYWYKSIVIV